MSQFFKFGQHVARVLNHHKTAAGAGDLAQGAGRLIGGWLGGGAKPVTQATSGVSGVRPGSMTSALSPQLSEGAAKFNAGATAAPKLTPMEAAEMARRNEAGIGYTMPTNRQPVAARAAAQNERALVEAGGGTPEQYRRVYEQTVAPHVKDKMVGAGSPQPVPPPPVPSRISPLDDVDMSAPLTGAQKFNAGIK